MNNIMPKPLSIGDTIGFVSPSSPLTPGVIEAGCSLIKDMGFKLKFGNHINDRNRFLAGKDEDRAKDIMDCFKDPKIKAIIAVLFINLKIFLF